MRAILSMVLLVWSCTAVGQAAGSSSQDPFAAFEVATVKPVDAGVKSGRMFRMDGTHRWIATNFTLDALIALAYDLNPRTISGGPGWLNTQHFVIEAVTPGTVQPTRLEQMRMLRALLEERFALKFHRQNKELSIYELTVAKGGPKLTPAANPEDPPQIIGVVYPDRVEVPARSVTMDDFVAMLQRATLDRPTVNRTGLTGKYDFDLKFAQDETVYGGELPPAPADANSPDLFEAVQEQLGLKLTAVRGIVSAMVVDSAHKPAVD